MQVEPDIRKHVVRICAQMLMPDWILAATAYAFEKGLWRLHCPRNTPTQMYYVQIRALVRRLRPEGLPGIWVPSQATYDAFEAGEQPMNAFGQRTPQGEASDEQIRRANALRARVWNGEISALQLAAWRQCDDRVPSGKKQVDRSTQTLCNR